MPKKAKKNPTDPNLLAREVAEAAIGEPLTPPGKVELHLGKVMTPESKLAISLEFYRRVTGKEPTPEDINACRAKVGLPKLEESSGGTPRRKRPKK